MSLGIHILLNLYDCQKNLLQEVSVVQSILEKITVNANLNKVGSTFHQFDPSGVTGVILLSESHICIHTWPEYNRAAIDVFCCCDQEKADKVSELVLEYFSPDKYDLKKISR